MAGPLDIGPSGGSDALGSVLSMATGMASGNPLAIASGAIGLGLQIFGGSQQTEAAKKKAEAEQRIFAIQNQQEAVRRKAMELNASRQQREVMRNAQRARALALTTATAQGAAQGTGLMGGYAQINGAAAWNNLGIAQNLDFGQQMFGLNAQINSQKQLLSSYESQAATGAGMGKLGGSLVNSFGPIHNISKTIGGWSSGGETYSGGDTIGQTASRIGNGYTW